MATEIKTLNGLKGKKIRKAVIFEDESGITVQIDFVGKKFSSWYCTVGTVKSPLKAHGCVMIGDDLDRKHEFTRGGA